MHLGIGILSGVIASAFTVAQLLSAPMWGRFSDKFGRRPALLVALGAAGVAYVVFGFADSLWVLFLSRIVQGAGGGTVGVIQAYVADSTEPEHRARSLGWLSAATNLGVALGPVVGAFAVVLGAEGPPAGRRTSCAWARRRRASSPRCCAPSRSSSPGSTCTSRRRQHHPSRSAAVARGGASRMFTHSGEPASRLIWIYAIAIGAFQGTFPVLALFLNDKFQVTEKTIGYFFMYIGSISVFARVLLLGKLVDRLGEARLSRFGLVLLALGLGTMPLAPNLLFLALSVALLPLGTAFTFPCVTALLSRVIRPAERGLYMGVQQSFGGVSRIIAPLVGRLRVRHARHGRPVLHRRGDCPGDHFARPGARPIRQASGAITRLPDEDDMTLALDGVRIVDLTQVMAGPFCTMLLADLGADVIKVEPPGGDLSRSMGGRRLHMKGKDHAPFIALNRNKRSIVLDLKLPADRDHLLTMLADADVLVENFRPGVAERLGIGFSTFATKNPRLIYCSISGFGQSGPWADRPGFDLIAQGMSGVMSVTGTADGKPVKCGIPISDLGGGPVRGERHPGRALRARENRPGQRWRRRCSRPR